MHPAPPDNPLDDPYGHLIQALIDQFAAGQSEALYGLHSASATLRRQAADLQSSVDQLPAALQPQLLTLLTAAGEQAATTTAALVAEHIAELQTTLGTETKRHATNLTATVKRSTAALEKAAVEAVALARAERALVKESVDSSLQTLRDEFAAAGQRLDEIADRHTLAAAEAESARGTVEATVEGVLAQLGEAQESFRVQLAEETNVVGLHLAEAATQAITEIEGATDVAMTRLEIVSARLEALASQVVGASNESLDSVIRASEQFSADAAAATAGLERVGENIVSRLIVVLEDRDRMDRAGQENFAARAHEITAHVEAQIGAATDELAAQTAAASQREATDRATAAAQLNDLLDRLLGLPRGKLKELRTTTRAQEDEGA